MSGNGLEDGSAHEIAVTLADVNSLQHVDLSNNDLSSRGLHVLVQSRLVTCQLSSSLSFCFFCALKIRLKTFKLLGKQFKIAAMTTSLCRSF